MDTKGESDSSRAAPLADELLRCAMSTGLELEAVQLIVSYGQPIESRTTAMKLISLIYAFASAAKDYPILRPLLTGELSCVCHFSWKNGQFEKEDDGSNPMLESFTTWSSRYSSTSSIGTEEHQAASNREKASFSCQVASIWICDVGPRRDLMRLTSL